MDHSSHMQFIQLLNLRELIRKTVPEDVYADVNPRVVKDSYGNPALLFSYWRRDDEPICLWDTYQVVKCFSFDEADEDSFIALNLQAYHTAVELGFEFSNATHSWTERGDCARAIMQDYHAQFREQTYRDTCPNCGSPEGFDIVSVDSCEGEVKELQCWNCGHRFDPRQEAEEE